MKKLLAVFCVFAVLLSMSLMNYSALLPPDYMGDVDCDWRIDVTDATAVQKHVAGIEELSGCSRYLADVDDDLRVTVKDATAIQKYVASVEGTFSVGDWFLKESYEKFYCSHLSGRAEAGEEVTFSTDGRGRYYRKEAYTNCLYVNDELVAEEKTNSFTYIFEEAGTYDVKLIGYSSYDTDVGGYIYTWNDFEVIEPSTQDEVVIKNIQCVQNPDSNLFYMDEGPFEFKVSAQGGSGKYEYMFVLDDYGISGNFFKGDSVTVDLRDFIEITDEWGYYYGEHTLYVYVRDALDKNNEDYYHYKFHVASFRPIG